jgi:hypothetical protein
MRALFPPWSNTALRLALAGLVLMLISVPVMSMVYVRTPWNTDQFTAVDQPVEFDHRHHAIDDGIDCLYCHYGAESSRNAGVPATEVCMGCHAQIHNDSPLLEPVRRSYFSGRSVPWNRVHDLGDFVYFDHAVHVQRDIGCVSCHGRVDRMPRVEKVSNMTMAWCLDCHRNYDGARGGHGASLADWEHTLGEPPTSEAADSPPEDYEPLRGQLHEIDLLNQYTRKGALTPLTTCTACHR